MAGLDPRLSGSIFLGDILVDKRDTIYSMLVIGDDLCPPPTFKPPLSLTTT
jgi:hypothetical protein